MPQYDCYTVEKNGAAATWLSFHKHDDEEACSYALALFDDDPLANRIEVWVGMRLVLSYGRTVEHTSDELRKLCALALEAARNESDPGIKRSIASYALSLAQEADAADWRANREAMDAEAARAASPEDSQIAPLHRLGARRG